MGSDPVKLITLDFLRDDGSHEKATLRYQTLAEARNVADTVFRKSDGLYLEVKITADNGYIETVSNVYATDADLWRV
jgi:hypothetical protein